MPAEYETSTGTPASRTAAAHALTGSVEKNAAGAPAITGTSTGAEPSLSGMRASIRLTATRSMPTADRCAASPTPITSVGDSSATAVRSTCRAPRNDTGSSRTARSSPSQRAATSCTASHDALTA